MNSKMSYCIDSSINEKLKHTESLDRASEELSCTLIHYIRSFLLVISVPCNKFVLDVLAFNH